MGTNVRMEELDRKSRSNSLFGVSARLGHDLESARGGRMRRPEKGQGGGGRMDVKGARALADRIAEAAKQVVSPAPSSGADPRPASDAPRQDDGANPSHPSSTQRPEEGRVRQLRRTDSSVRGACGADRGRPVLSSVAGEACCVLAGAIRGA